MCCRDRLLAAYSKGVEGKHITMQDLYMLFLQGDQAGTSLGARQPVRDHEKYPGCSSSSQQLVVMSDYNGGFNQWGTMNPYRKTVSKDWTHVRKALKSVLVLTLETVSGCPTKGELWLKGRDFVTTCARQL